MTAQVFLDIPGTHTEPKILFADGVLQIRGKSIPTDSLQIYGQVIEMFYRYSRKPNDKTEIHIDLEYINSSSNRSLLNLLIVAEHLFREGHFVQVTWYYESSDPLMLEQGIIFRDLLSLPFSMVAKL